MTPDKSVIELLMSGDKNAMELFYNSQRATFISWAKKRFDCDEDTILDVFQDAIVTLYFNVKEGKITSFDTTIEAYLFGMARNMMLKRNIKYSKLRLYEDPTKIPLDLDYDIYERISSDHDKAILSQALNQLKDKCKEIIQLFYYHRNSIEAIANKLNYTNTDVVKSRKNQCMNHLRKIFLSGFKS